MRLLIVEDEPKLAALLARGLRESGHAVDLAGTGEEALWRAGSAAYDVVVLDVGLPGIDGFETCRRLRADDQRAPVLFLTARDGVDDRIAGLDGGGDDYLVKPFDFGELEARLRALVRRGAVARDPVLEAGPLRLDPAARRAWHGAAELDLSAKEFVLLEALMRRPGEALDRRALLEAGWDDSYEQRSNVVDVYVGYLRHKVDRPFGTALSRRCAASATASKRRRRDRPTLRAAAGGRRRDPGDGDRPARAGDVPAVPRAGRAGRVAGPHARRPDRRRRPAVARGTDARAGGACGPGRRGRRRGAGDRPLRARARIDGRAGDDDAAAARPGPRRRGRRRHGRP